MDTERVTIVFGDCILGVKSGNMHYIFSYARDGLESLNKDGKKWLYQEALPVFWRTTTGNDRGSGFGFRSGMWLGVGLCPEVKEIEVLVSNRKIDSPITPMNNQYSSNEYAETVEIIFTPEINTIPRAQVTISYQITGKGKVLVNMHYYGQKELPELSALGLRFIIPTKVKFFEYEDLPGEIYPDQMAGGVEDIYKVAGLSVSPYLIPQECGVHMETKWVELAGNQTLDNTDRDQEDFSLRFEQQDTPFAFSVLPFKVEELEQAAHIEELPPERRTALTIFAKIKGVRGINSWGADAESPYRISNEGSRGIGFIIQ